MFSRKSGPERKNMDMAIRREREKKYIKNLFSSGKMRLENVSTSLVVVWFGLNFSFFYFYYPDYKNIVHPSIFIVDHPTIIRIIVITIIKMRNINKTL